MGKTTANPLLGVVLHAIGGLAAASFYIPYKRVKGWSWETYWIVGGVFSWIVAPWAVSLAILPEHPGDPPRRRARARSPGPSSSACCGASEG